MSFPNCLMRTEQNEGTLIIYDSIEKEYKFLYESDYNGETFLTNHKEIEEKIKYYGLDSDDLENCCIMEGSPVLIYWLEA